ncbi:MAG TPA: tRNA pseudouridine(55) synthase TruB [Acidimicrobiales bacterium]|nr:tRNA pseudouridine(55) synthase TruB [Acidimicrobiales bacterium]
MSQVDGLVVIDKPTGCTSHDVVARCRRIFGQRKVGHAGTLDPDATGVLLVGLGRATRLLQWLTGLPKHYTGQVVLGVATTTLDAGGQVKGTWDMRAVTLDEARSAAARLTGEITQVPPMVSALKVGGRRLHELAREGVEVERAARPVTVRRFDVDWAVPAGPSPVLAIDVECSSGTYVRSLAADLGTLLGGGAHLRNLRRTAVGDFSVERAVTLEQLEASPTSIEAVLEPASALPGMARAVVGHEMAAAVRNGKVLPADVLRAAGGAEPGAGPWAVLAEDGQLLAVYQTYGTDLAKPAVVLA